MQEPMSRELELLDEVEEIRQKAADQPESYPTDYAIRAASARIARYLGYKSRSEWTQKLKEHQSKYAQRIEDQTLHI